jgi:hypothetical protein
MFTAPWQPVFGPSQRWRLTTLPSCVVAAIVLVWFFRYGGLLSDLAWWFLTPEGDTTLELPEELVLARLPWSFAWNPDVVSDGVLVAVPENDDPTGSRWAVERWNRPWQAGTREPLPPEWHVGVPPDWRDQHSILWHFGLNSPVTHDRRLLAVVDHPAGKAPQTRVLALPGGQELARLEAIPAGVNGKCMAWHPSENVLAIGANGAVTLAAAPDWQPRRLATAGRDFAEWEARVRRGEDENGYHPSENVSQLLFSDDGALLLAAMDRGVRVYDWQEIRRAADRLPTPRHSAEGVLVQQPLASFKMTFSVAHDARRHLVLWSENDGKLKCLNLETGAQTALLALSNRYCFTRLHLCRAADALIAEIVRIGKANNGPFALVVMDYPKLLDSAPKGETE